MRVLIQNRLEQFDGSLIFFSGKQVLDFIAGSIRRGILELEHMKMRRISQRVGDGVWHDRPVSILQQFRHHGDRVKADVLF